MIHCKNKNPDSESGLMCGTTQLVDLEYSERRFREALVCHMPFRSKDGSPREKVRGINVAEVPHYVCKSCARSINARDAAFQRKARRQFREGPARLRSYNAEAAYQVLVGKTDWSDVALAIAREEP